MPCGGFLPAAITVAVTHPPTRAASASNGIGELALGPLQVRPADEPGRSLE